MKNYDLYLFDFDGTLVNSIKSLIDIFVLSFKAIDVEVEVKNVLRYTRQPLEDTYQELNAPIERIGEFATAIRHYLDDEEIMKKTELYPETLEFINYMHAQGKQIGIVTSNNEKHVKDTLSYLNVPLHYFVVYIDNEKVNETKPSPKPILAALEEINYQGDKHNVVYVGDALNDMQSAINAGVDGMLIDRLDEFKESDQYQRITNLFDVIK